MTDISSPTFPGSLQREQTSSGPTRFRSDTRDDEDAPLRVTVLHLRPLDPSRQQPRNARVTWNEQVQDNPQQRVSKCCCVFHKKKLFGESSSDDSSSSSSDSDNNDDGDGHPDAIQSGRGGGTEGAGGAGDVLRNEEEGEAHPHPHPHPHHHRRPKCTKEHCYCGTRFH